MNRHRKYLILSIAILGSMLLLTNGLSYAKYVSNSIWNYYLKSKGFYFESNEEYLNNLIIRYNEGEYMLVDELLCTLSYYYSTSDVKKILTEKCWLIEEH